MRRKVYWQIVALSVALVLLSFGPGSVAQASVQVPQTALPGNTIQKFVEPLMQFYPNRVPASPGYDVVMKEFQQKVLPSSFYQKLPQSVTVAPGLTIKPQDGTYVWGYQVGNAPAFYPGYTVEAQRFSPAQVTYYNKLGSATQFPVLQKYLTVDQSIHWANPLMAPLFTAPNVGNTIPYRGPQPGVVHLHGGENRSDSDGHPEAWWTPGAEGITFPPLADTYRGPAYQDADPAKLTGNNPSTENGNVYTYPNGQEATTLWFHDHTLGAVRLTVFAGEEAFYLIRDQFDTGKADNKLKLPAAEREVELVIQDRQFDTLGQLLFPDGHPAGLNGPPPNPVLHPYWIPEFFGDVSVVNGKSWPYLEVAPVRYRFRLLNASNARFFTFSMNATQQGANSRNVAPGPPFWVIGTDGGLLDTPVKADSFTVGVAERYDVIVDFSQFKGQVVTLINTAKAPFPGGAPADPQTVGQIMQFRVGNTAVEDATLNPAAQPTPTLRGGPNQNQPAPIVRLADGKGGLNPAVVPTIKKKRQLVLREVEGPGGPIEVLLNNTRWAGLREAPNNLPMGLDGAVPGSVVIQPQLTLDRATELPQIGSTEEWELVNTTGDAHPIHIHLIQFQVVNRQSYRLNPYVKTYEAAFPPGVHIDGYGPPMDYNSTADPTSKNFTGFYGGNPDVTPFLGPQVEAPHPWEAGWKDTIISMPGQVTRLIMRWTPQDLPIADYAGQNLFTFNATRGPGYVWHCHIIDHEDNEMMRPYIPTANDDNTYAPFVP